MPSIDKAYQWAVQVCQSHNARYSQASNLRAGGISGGHVYYDCSGFISRALQAGGFNNGVFTTHEEEGILRRLGFNLVTDGTVKSGDIGWKSGHTEMAFSSGSNNRAVFMGAHTNRYPGPYQVSIGTYSNGAYNQAGTKTFTHIWRYGNGATGEDPGEGETASSGKGYSPYVVAAICGCWWVESNVNPGVWESLTPVAWTALYHNNTGGYGLGQWTNTSAGSGMRLYRLYQWMTANHFQTGSMDGQLEYLTVENYWTYKSAYTGYHTLSEFLNSDSTDLSSLVTQFLACWEGVPGNALQLRIEHAQTIYAYIIAHASDPLPDPISSNNYLSEVQILNNALYIYKKLGQSGTGNSRPSRGKSKKKSMPIWMMLRNLF